MQANKQSHECQVHVGMEQRAAVFKTDDLFALLGRWPLDKDLKEVRTWQLEYLEGRALQAEKLEQRLKSKSFPGVFKEPAQGSLAIAE